MPKKMVDGVYHKIKKFCGCGKLLTGTQSRYCSRTCYVNQRKDYERINYHLHNPPLPDRICITCGENYTPRISRQKCCSRHCRDEFTKTKNREYRSKNRVFKRALKWWKSPDVEIVEKETVVTTVTGIENSAYQSEIAEYLKDGGKVRVLVPQVNAHTPGVTVPFHIKTDENYNMNLGQWGVGFDLDFMEETSNI